MGVKYIFWNNEEFRVRAGWRIISQLILVAVFTNVFVYADKYFKEYLPSNPSIPNYSFFQPLELFMAIFLSMLITAKYLDKRKMSEFGFHIDKKWISDLSAGLIMGIILISAIFTTEYLAGWITITGSFQTANDDYSFSYAIISSGFMFLCVGFYEEMQVRGYLLKNLSEGFNLKNDPKRGILIAVLISSLIFGFGHASNPNATLVSSISISLAGILLASGYLITGRLAIPIGFHISWNFFQGYVFGFPVSGNTSSASIIIIEQGGPDIWTGGSFGPEAGLIGILSFILGIFLTILWVKYNDKKIELNMDIAEYKIPHTQKNELIEKVIE
ncbi:MAG: CPBP family intramembrane metalloprotease [Bacteroidetes bacterium]|nr:CPBP family intramembrane metalloprotease [Bacteroidota bacterium]